MNYVWLAAAALFSGALGAMGMGGGGVLNWSFLQAGLCDEISLVVAPAADGNPTTPSLFSAKKGISKDKPISFTLIGAQEGDGNALWLRYRVNHPESEIGAETL